MKKKLAVFQIIYYVLIVIIFLLFMYVSMLFLDLCNGSLGFIIFAICFVLYAMIPILIIILMRFSLLKWYVDPIAAFMIPFFLYVVMIINNTNRTHDLKASFLLVNDKLADDGGAGFMFFLFLFVLGIVASFSIKRRKGSSISYKILSGFDKTADEGDDTE